MRRSKQRVAEIDSFIEKHYATKGIDYCAEKLGEPRTYVMGRANHKRITVASGSGNAKTAKKVDPRDARIEKLEKEKEFYRLELVRLVGAIKRAGKVIEV